MILAAGKEATLSDLYRLILKRRGIFTWVTATVVIISVILAFTTKHQYTSVSTIQIQKSSSDGLNLDKLMGAASGGGGDSLSSNVDMETQAKILQSESLGLQVISDLDMEHNPEFAHKSSVLGAVTSVFQSSNSPEPSNVPLRDTRFRRAEVLDIFRKNLEVKVVPGTRLLQVSYSDPDPKLSADVVNHIVQGLIDFTFQTKYKATTDVSAWLEGQLGDLRNQSEALQARVVAMQKETGLFGAGGVDSQGRPIIYSPTLDSLTQATNELSQAEANLVLKGAVDQVVRTGNPELISQLSGTSVSGGSSPGVANSLQLIQALRTQEATLNQEINHDASLFGSAFPRLIQERASLNAVEQSLKEESVRLATRASNDYQVALKTAAGSKKAYETQRESASKLNDKTIAYTILEKEATQSSELYQDLLRRLKEAGILEGLHSSNLTVVDRATPPAMPSKPSRKLYVLLGLLLGLISGLVSSFLIDAIDNVVRGVEEFDAISLPLLGVLPDTEVQSIESGLFVAEKPKSQFAENLRNVRSSLYLSRSGKPPQVVLVTSSVPSEGKSTISLNLSAILAQQGKKVLLIEADLRKPSILRKLHTTSNGSGLSQILSSEEKLVPIPIQIQPGMFVLPAGPVPPLPAELIGSDRMGALIAEARSFYDFIVIDSPPILPVTDTRMLARLADATLLVVRADQTHLPALNRAYEILKQGDQGRSSDFIGGILNGLTPKSPSYNAYYGTRYEEYYLEGADK
jgi:succinoglycan biosynthesis transport protein ExoP